MLNAKRVAERQPDRVASTWVHIQPRPLLGCSALSKEGANVVCAPVSPPRTGTVTATLRDRTTVGPGTGPPRLRVLLWLVVMAPGRGPVVTSGQLVSAGRRTANG